MRTGVYRNSLGHRLQAEVGVDMEWYVFCIAGLALAVIWLFVRLCLMKKNVKKVLLELKQTREENYRSELRVTLSDRQFLGLVTEINRNLQYQNELKSSAEASRNQLRESIADIAHDLRTPLTVVKGNLQMLEGEQLSERGRECLEAGERRAESLKGMVDEFFELTVLESDSREAELEAVDMTGFLTEFVIDNEALIREKGLTPELHFPGKSIFAQANRELLSRVFSNLMTNIYKYGEDRFSLSVREEETGCVVELLNPVKAGTQLDCEHIFDRTYRADKSRTDGSAGLGLYIVKLLMEKQKGSITAHCEDNELKFIMTWK